jgi:carbon monoxide dehydrogenase subunit G
VTLVHCAIEIAAAPADVWEVVMDPRRLRDWVTIHRRLGPVPERLRQGSAFEQSLGLRGAHVTVHWTVVELDPPRRAVWEGRGPAHSHASIEYLLEPLGGQRTRFDYVNEFKAPGGPLGAVAGRVLVAGVSQREAQRSLERLKRVVERAAAGDTA